MDKLSPKALMQAGLDAQSEAGNKKPVKVIKKGDMSPETKALPDETRPTPKGIGKSENDMDPMLKGAKASDEADKQRAAMEKAMLKGASMGGMGPMQGIKKGGAVKKYSKGGTASSRADGIATKGKTRGKIC
jgi:hypothetical protein